MPRRCDGDSAFKVFLGAPEELVRNIHCVARVAELDGGEMGFLGFIRQLRSNTPI
jgi:hypothetical protein